MKYDGVTYSCFDGNCLKSEHVIDNEIVINGPQCSTRRIVKLVSGYNVKRMSDGIRNFNMMEKQLHN